MEMTILGYVLVGIAGGLLHEVPLPRFILALVLITVGMNLVR